MEASDWSGMTGTDHRVYGLESFLVRSQTAARREERRRRGDHYVVTGGARHCIRCITGI